MIYLLIAIDKKSKAIYLLSEERSGFYFHHKILVCNDKFFRNSYYAEIDNKFLFSEEPKLNLEKDLIDYNGHYNMVFIEFKKIKSEMDEVFKEILLLKEII